MNRFLFSKILLHVVMIEFFFLSGEQHYTSFIAGGKSLVLFLGTCSLYFYTKRKNAIIRNDNILTLLIIVVWVIASAFLWGQGHHDFFAGNYIFYPLAVLLLISASDFDKLRNLLLKYLVVLSAVSIVVQIGHDYFGIFPASTYFNALGNPHRLSLGLFSTEWGEKRLSSIFWEPGQYQIVIYYILILFADEWSDIKMWRKSLRKFGILIIAILLTISTTAYIILLLIVFTIVIRNGNKHIILYPIYIVSGLVISSYVIGSDAIQKKIAESDNDRSSYAIRLQDNIACWKVTMDDPLTGYGPGSDLLKRKLIRAGSETSSNGWLYGSAQLGIPYILFFWFCFWQKLRKMHKGIPVVFLLAALILSQANEATINYPYLYLYIFYYNKLPEIKKHRNRLLSIDR